MRCVAVLCPRPALLCPCKAMPRFAIARLGFVHAGPCVALPALCEPMPWLREAEPPPSAAPLHRPSMLRRCSAALVWALPPRCRSLPMLCLAFSAMLRRCTSTPKRCNSAQCPREALLCPCPAPLPVAKAPSSSAMPWSRKPWQCPCPAVIAVPLRSVAILCRCITQPSLAAATPSGAMQCRCKAALGLGCAWLL